MTDWVGWIDRASQAWMALTGRLSTAQHYKAEIESLYKAEIERLRADRDKWVEYVTCDRAQLVLDLEATLARPYCKLGDKCRCVSEASACPNWIKETTVANPPKAHR